MAVASPAMARPAEPDFSLLQPHVPQPQRSWEGVAFLNGQLGAHTLTSIDEQIFFDPSSGTVSATITAQLTAGPGGFVSLIALLDQGLVFERAWNDQGDLNMQAVVQQGFSYAQVNWPGVATEGTAVTINLSYAGVLACPSQGGFSSCDWGGQRLDFITAGSAFVSIYDPVDNASTPYYRRNLTLSMPSGNDVALSAEELSRTEDGSTLTVAYSVPVRHELASYVAVFGDLVRRPVPGLSIPAQVVHLASDTVWSDEIIEWTATIVDYLDMQAGAAFPYPMLNMVKLPASARFPGTAGHSMSLLNHYYGDVSARYFEETFAHETSHVWWAVLTTDERVNTRFLSEGLATFTQLDYAATQIFPERDRDTYLGARYNELKNTFLYATPFESLPPVVPAPGVDGPVNAYQQWAYLKGAAVLELLRMSIGEDTFAQGLRSYAQACTNQPCSAEDFQAAFEGSAGELNWFFSQYVYASETPSIRIGFEQVEIAEGFELTVTLTPDDGLTNEVELLIDLENGERTRARIRVEGALATGSINIPSRALRVRPNPRMEPVIRFYTANDEDVDFDAELDGADLIHCARLVGMAAFDAQQRISDGILTGNLEFDARCDRNRNGLIELDDLDQKRASFPQVQP